MFAEQGSVHELNMRELARRCAVSHAAPYRHFDDAHELVRAVAARGFELLDQEHAAVVLGLGDVPALTRYVALGTHYVDWAQANCGYFYAMAESGPLGEPDRGEPSWPGVLARQIDLIEEAQAEGWRTDTPAQVLALGGWIYTQGIVRMLLAGELDRLGDGRRLADALFQGAAGMPMVPAATVRMLHREQPAAGSGAADAVLGASAELIAHGGLSRFSIREVARRSGVSTSVPSKLFGDREGTLRALAREGYDLLDRELAETVREADAKGSDLLDAVVEGYASFACDHPGHIGVMWRSDIFPNGEHPPGWDDTAALIRLRDSCRVWLDRRDLEAPTADALAFAILSLVHGAATLWLDGESPAAIDRRDFRALAATTLAALRLPS